MKFPPLCRPLRFSFSGAIPSLFFKGLTRGKKFAGWEKIKLKREIEAVVREYLEYGINRREKFVPK